jgi:hypothetical protein
LSSGPGGEKAPARRTRRILVGMPITAPSRLPNVHPACRNVPGRSDGGFEEICHLVGEEDPDTALCGADVTGYPWNPPWPRCEACLAVARGQLN